MSWNDPELVVHRHVAMLLCETDAVMAEFIGQLELGHIPYKRLGSRALIAPAKELEAIKRALRERGIHPRQLGPKEVQDTSNPSNPSNTPSEGDAP